MSFVCFVCLQQLFAESHVPQEKYSRGKTEEWGRTETFSKTRHCFHLLLFSLPFTIHCAPTKCSVSSTMNTFSVIFILDYVCICVYIHMYSMYVFTETIASQNVLLTRSWLKGIILQCFHIGTVQSNSEIKNNLNLIQTVPLAFLFNHPLNSNKSLVNICAIAALTTDLHIHSLTLVF